MTPRGFPRWVNWWAGKASVRPPRHRALDAAHPSLTEPRLRADAHTLRQIIEGLERLQERAERTEIVNTAEQRGYLTPAEDDRVRQGLMAYRNYRLALYDIILRLEHYSRLKPVGLRLKAFLLAFVAALTLYAKSLRLDELAARSELVRAKLNEPEPKFDLEAGFFDEVMSGFCSLRNYGLILRALWFWSTRRRAIRALARREPEPWAALEKLAISERRTVQAALTRVLRNRLKFGWLAFWRAAFKPMGRAHYGLRSQVGGRFAGFWLQASLHQALDDATLRQLHRRLRAGDVLVMRSEGKLTATLLPGFWAHAALYLGDHESVNRLNAMLRPRGGTDPLNGPEGNSAAGVPGHPAPARDTPDDRRAGVLPAGGNDPELGYVIEAVSPCVRVVPLKTCLDADHLLVLRPRLEPEAIGDALCESLRHLGKAYDFEFDFNLSNRIVCTGLVYRSYHGRGGIGFSLIKRLGHFTLTGDDLVTQALAIKGHQPAAFEPVALVLRRPKGWQQTVDPARVRTLLRRIERGWRPIRG